VTYIERRGDKMSRSSKKLVLLLLDSFIILLANAFTYLFLDPYIVFNQQNLFILSVFILAVYIGLAFYYKLFNKISRYTGIKETAVHVGIVASAYIFPALVMSLFYSLSQRFVFLAGIISAVLVPGSRIIWRVVSGYQYRRKNGNGEFNQEPLRTLVVGAGEAGAILVKRLRYDSGIHFAGVVDDDKTKHHTLLYDVPVLGSISDIHKITESTQIDQITVAIPSMGTEELNRIVEFTSNTGAKINRMPSVENIVSGKYQVNRFKEIDVVDLLGREEVKLDMGLIGEQLANQTVLVSGAGGSIGSEISRQIMKFSPKRILLLGHGEFSIYQINRELKALDTSTEIVPIIADIQDRNRIFEVMEEYKPDRVYHAAAHKHVPLMQYNPREAVKNNIYGTKNMAEGAKAAGVQSFVMVSTDKAVNPPNVMGATKRIAEMIVTGLNEKGKTNFVAVRFGNVLNSRGSVVPLFKEQIKKGGPITATDFQMTRFFMTIPEASRLVLQAGSLADGGEIFILDMGESVKIADLARKMIHLSGVTESEIEIKEAGIRPGEKLYEELLTDGEAVEEQVYEKIFVGNVTNQPINEVLDFVSSLKYLNEEELKTNLIQFANNEYTNEIRREKDVVSVY